MHEKKDWNFIDWHHFFDSNWTLFQTRQLDSRRDWRCALGYDGLLPLAHNISQEGVAADCTCQSGTFFSRGIFTVDSLALAGVIPKHIHRPHDVGTRIPVDRPSGLLNRCRHHLLGV